MMGVFAEFERSIMQERIRAGMVRARAQGKHLGRPRIPAKTERAIRRALAGGGGIHKVAKTYGVGSGTVQRIRGTLPSAGETRPMPAST